MRLTVSTTGRPQDIKLPSPPSHWQETYTQATKQVEVAMKYSGISSTTVGVDEERRGDLCQILRYRMASLPCTCDMWIVKALAGYSGQQSCRAPREIFAKHGDGCARYFKTCGWPDVIRASDFSLGRKVGERETISVTWDGPCCYGVQRSL